VLAVANEHRLLADLGEAIPQVKLSCGLRAGIDEDWTIYLRLHSMHNRDRHISYIYFQIQVRFTSKFLAAAAASWWLRFCIGPEFYIFLATRSGAAASSCSGN
jgi:hypothetical protein